MAPVDQALHQQTSQEKVFSVLREVLPVRSLLSVIARSWPSQRRFGHLRSDLCTIRAKSSAAPSCPMLRVYGQGCMSWGDLICCWISALFLTVLTELCFLFGPPKERDLRMTVISLPACWETEWSCPIWSFRTLQPSLWCCITLSFQVNPQGWQRGCAVLCRAFAYTASRLIPWRSFSINMAGNAAKKRQTLHRWALCMAGQVLHVPFSSLTDSLLSGQKPRLTCLPAGTAFFGYFMGAVRSELLGPSAASPYPR